MPREIILMKTSGLCNFGLINQFFFFNNLLWTLLIEGVLKIMNKILFCLKLFFIKDY